MKIASESGHWYDVDGNTAYEVEYADKSKGMRPTTLRDARKLNLFPSVTTVLSVLAKPGLDAWKQNQNFHAVYTHPETAILLNEDYDTFYRVISEDANEQMIKARDKGTEIHGVIENFYLNGVVDPYHAVIIEAVDKAIKDEFGDVNWSAEKSFTCRQYGYGGKIDLHSNDGEGIVLDFKTKEFGEDDKRLHWDEQAIQLAAYANGLGLYGAILGNVYISTNNPGLVKIHLWPESVGHYYEPFHHALQLWKWQKNYDPCYPDGKPF